MEKLNLKKEGLKLIAGLVYVIIFYLVVVYFKLNMYEVYGLVMLSSLVMLLISKRFKWKALFINAIVVALLFVVIRYLGGVGGFFLSTAAICGFILVTKRKKFVEVKQHIESMIWGKPIKDYVKEGEKLPKLKFR